jgi:SAM-dependent methyltransferase
VHGHHDYIHLLNTFPNESYTHQNTSRAFTTNPHQSKPATWTTAKNYTNISKTSPRRHRLEDGTPCGNKTSRPETSELVQRKKALVPGCGRGYDVLLLASYGYDAYGADVSQTAIDACNELDQNQAEDAARYPIKDGSIGRGSRNFLLADFFNDDLLSHTGGSKFDVIYDYTFLCAIPPQLRPKWAAKMSSLLAPGGSLICLEFPLAKSPTLGGPPHGLSSDLYVQLFKRPGDDVKYGDDGYIVSEDRELDSQNGLVRVTHFEPERTHEGVGKGDMMSIWKHAGDSEGASRSTL